MDNDNYKAIQVTIERIQSSTVQMESIAQQESSSHAKPLAKSTHLTTETGELNIAMSTLKMEEVVRVTNTEGEHAVKKMVKSEAADDGTTPKEKKKKRKLRPIAEPSKEFRVKENGICSMFMIEIEEGKKAYRYDIDIMEMNKQKSLTRGADDGQRALNRNICYELLTVAYSKTCAFGMLEGGEVVYDCKCTMYTSMPINMCDGRVEISREEVNDYVRMYTGNADFTINIAPNQQKPVLELSDFRQYLSTKSLFEEDRSVRTFLEMCITQFSINNNIYSPVGSGKLFEVTQENQQRTGNGLVLRSGIAKGVRVVQNYGKPAPALVLDAKISPFYEAQELVNSVFAIMNNRMPNMNDWGRIRHVLMDVRVEVMYARHRSFGIGRFTDKPMEELTVSYQGKKMLMPLYFQRRYGITLQFPGFPAVIPNTPVPKGRPVELFPVEQLVIMEDQRVPVEKIDKGLSEKLLKANTILPHERMDKIMQHATDMGVFNESNPVLRAFGIRVNVDSNRIVIGVRSCPRILYANNQIVAPDPEKADWRKQGQHTQYLETNEIGNWIVLTDGGKRDIVDKFIKELMTVARKKGLQFAKPPSIIPFGQRGANVNWPEMFQRCVNKNIEFIMLIDNKSEDTHGLLKYYEAYFRVITQHVTLERVVDVVSNGKKETLSNIINKTNCKNFGINYIPLCERSADRLSLGNGKVLVIGYDVAHPPPVSQQERRILKVKGLTCDSLDPSVVGICANMATNAYNFVGDYFYQESRKESLDVHQLSDRITWILQMVERNRPAHARPKYIIVLRDGLSEGQFAMAIEEEIPAIKMGCMEYDESYKPKLMFVVGTKRHYKKFFAIRNGEIVNLLPGSVVNEKIVRPDVAEFFMQSHHPLKGTGKPVEYSVLVDEIGVTQDQLQGFLNALCFSHQIANVAISLPEPIYQADELAKRGRNNYLAMKRFFPQAIPRKNALVDMRKLTEMLSYRNTRLSATRFTA